MPEYYNPGEINEKAKQILMRDLARMGSLNYSPYPGKTLSPMSSLTQKAQEVEAMRAAKGTPYKNSLQAITARQPMGLEGPQRQGLLDDLRNRHGTFNTNITENRLNKQFGNSFDPLRAKYASRNLKDTNARLGETGADLNTLSEGLKGLESRRNATAFGAVNNSSLGKLNRQGGLVNTLNQFGTQKQGINNMHLTEAQAKFNAEKNDPHERLSNLQRAIAGNADMDHPDLAAVNGQNMVKALQAYGVDTNKPINEWGNGDSKHIGTYQGKLIDPINQEMKESYKLAEEIDPKYQDRNYVQRKAIRKDLSSNNPANNPTNQVIGGLNTQLDPKYGAIDNEAKRRAKEDMNRLNAKYIKQGTYGSQAHMQDAAGRMRQLNEGSLGARTDVLKKELNTGLATKYSNDIDKIQKLGQYDQSANTEFNDMLGDIKRTNTQGIEKWKNNNLGNEQLYKAYQNEKGYQQPRMLGNATNTGIDRGIGAGIGGMHQYFSNQGIDLNTISDLQGRYSNLEKELKEANNRIKNEGDFRNQQQAAQQRIAQQQAADRQRALDAERMARERAEQERLSKINILNQYTTNVRNIDNNPNNQQLHDQHRNFLNQHKIRTPWYTDRSDYNYLDTIDPQYTQQVRDVHMSNPYLRTLSGPDLEKIKNTIYGIYRR